MGEFTKIDRILLFDTYSVDSRNLHVSFQRAGYDLPAVVIDDDGFLPEGVMSVYGFFLGNFKGEKGVPGKPRYFNQITVPDYWEISGNNSSGKVHDLYRERGRIFYAEPKHKRLVKVVDWYDERGTVRSSDHYNRYGALFARTALNAKGQRVNKSYFSAAGREILVENYVTGDIILNEDGGVRFFPNKTEFICYFMEKTGMDRGRLYFNSLSTPFFVSNKLAGGEKGDILFWQEPVRDGIPGNMEMILKGQAGRAAKVMVQKRQSYYRLLELGASPEKVHRLGYVYPFAKENGHRKEALICTNSDRIEHCRELVEALPEMHFHIAAITEMSSKLLAMGAYDNVSLYPGVKTDILEELFDTCDFYLDVNHESEILSAVRRAFLHNQLIFAFRETVHSREYAAEDHIYPAAGADRMIGVIREAMEKADVLEAELQKQREAAFAESAEKYQQL